MEYATDAQVAYLVQLGMSPADAARLDKHEAIYRIAQLKERPSPAQRAYLKSLKFQAEQIDCMTRDEARERISELVATRTKPVEASMTVVRAPLPPAPRVVAVRGIWEDAGDE
jgi:hypothetical protein